MDKKYTEFAVEKTLELLNIPSPSGYTEQAAAYVQNAFAALGYEARRTVKGGVLVDLGGKNVQDGLMLEAHTDTLGAMVAEVKGSGRLRVTPLGGMNANNAEAENVTVFTRDGRSYEGTFQLCNPSIHVNGDYSSTLRSFDNTEVVLDEKTASAKETRELGIEVGDIVCFDPRSRVTRDGYIKSRFLDDKLSAAILLGLARAVAAGEVTLSRKVSLLFTVYEEVGHGGAFVPADTREMISVDMGCVGDDLGCTERMVSICAKDSGGPYNYDLVTTLSNIARELELDYAIDVYPHYGSDVEATLSAGNDIRHGLIGPGVYASHNYERSHIDGVRNTYELVRAYVQR